MFVLPPPPRYPAGAYGVGLGGIVPLIETNNTLSNPSGPEYRFLVGEGTYVLKEDLNLATPPPHPSEAPVVNPNPLATTPQPATAGTKMSILSLDARPAPFFYKGPSATTLSLSGGTSSIQEHPYESRYSTEGGMSSEDGRAASSEVPTASITLGSAPAFGEGNSLLAPTVTKDVNKKKKPKNNVTKSNSSFISRVIVNDSLARKLTERPSDGLFAFANINRAFQWLDMSSPTKGIINNTPVSEIRWIPGSDNLFLAAHMDGLLVVYDKEKEDGHLNPEEEGLNASGSGSEGELSNGSAIGNGIRINKSVHSKNQKTNPVAAWKLSNQRINAFSFSPDNRHLAVVSEDGTLRVIDYLKEELLDLYHSYYGGLSCVCWTPDGKYVLTGGQDDLISIWSMADSALVARCQGHRSWVSALAFDPWRCDDRNYRFGSVGEDGRLCLWDFSVGMLHRPKTAAPTRHRGSVSSRITAPQRTDTNTSVDSGGKGGFGLEDEWEENVIAHPVQPRAVIPMLPPVLTHVVDTHPACWLAFTEDAVITSCKSGHVRTWNRPGIQSATQ
ncbi:hypothetical protein ACHAQJ_010231 [Trichoderma viride]